MANLFIEALVVGLVSGFFGLIISTALMLFSHKFSWKKYDFWPRVFLSFFLTGLLLHLVFEWVGANKWYCRHGNACK